MSKEQIEKTVTDYFAAVRSMDAEAFVAVFAADAVSHDPVGAPPVNGYDGLRKFFHGIESTFSQLIMTETAVYINKNEAAVHWQAEGTSKDSKITHFSGIDIFTFNDEGKISSLRAYWDPRAMMAQLKG